LQKYPKAIFFFFLLEQKETKIQDNSPTSIYPAEAFLNGGSLRIAKASHTITNVCRDLF
jgi:hypothetical protein